MGKYRPVKQLCELKRGTIVRHVGSERPFTVTGNYGSHVTAVATVDITNPTEWEWFDENSAQGKKNDV